MIYMNFIKPIKPIRPIKSIKPIKVIKDMLKPNKGRENMLFLVLLVYILSNVQTPMPLATLVDNVFGNAAVAITAIVFFMKTKSVVGVLSIIAAYELIKRSSVKAGSHALRNYVPCEHKKLADFKKYNEFPVTLEEEIISKMAPLVKHAPSKNSDYKPVLCDLHEAASATSNDM